jgi:hypothetical protein
VSFEKLLTLTEKYRKDPIEELTLKPTVGITSGRTFYRASKNVDCNVSIG